MMITARFQPPHGGIPAAAASPSSSKRHGDGKPNSILDRYQMGNKIGEGSFGVVYQAINKKSGALVRQKCNRSKCSISYFDVTPFSDCVAFCSYS